MIKNILLADYMTAFIENPGDFNNYLKEGKFSMMAG